LVGERAALIGCAPMEQADRPEPRPSCLKTAPRVELRFLSGAASA